MHQSLVALQVSEAQHISSSLTVQQCPLEQFVLIYISDRQPLPMKHRARMGQSLSALLLLQYIVRSTAMQDPFFILNWTVR